MKKIKKITSLLLAILILFSCIPVSVSAEEYTYCKKGDIIEFGSYPQTKVTDESLLAELDAIEKDWQSLNYYMGTGDSTTNTMFPSDYTKYYDFEYNNEKYRAIYFTMYRPSDVYGSTFRAGQYGYDLNTVYYFKYEPIKWKVLDPDTGFVVSDVLLDSQPFSNEFYYDSDSKKYYTDDTLSVYANNYELSSIRQWLNDDFYNASFSSEQKSDIITSIVNNDNIDPNYSSAETEDNIYILSQKEFNKYDEELLGTDNDYKVNATDYAMCQGLPRITLTNDNGTYIGYSWLLRTASNNNGRADTVKSIYIDGQSENVYIYKTNLGIRPACKLNGLKSNDTSEYKTGDIIEYGNYPQTKVTDENLISELDAIEKNWVSYNYYMGTDDTNSAENINSAHPSDYAKYCDLVYNNEKYRAVYFTMYRPNYTYELSGYSSDNYYTDTIYYFKYEPIKWKVLDPDTGFVVSNIILDSQPYNNKPYYYSDTYYTDETRSSYSNNYELSSIRQWLNDDFYNTSFSLKQKGNITVSTLNNDAKDYSIYNAEETEDNIFLLSATEFNKYVDELKLSDDYMTTVTDYSLCQGAQATHRFGGGSLFEWNLRTAGMFSNDICYVDVGQEIHSSSVHTYDVTKGIRPACRLSVLKSDTEMIESEERPPYKTGDIIEFGNYPQTKVTDENLIAELDTIEKDWQSLNYYEGTGNISNAEYINSAHPSDYAKYCDLVYNNEQYRAIYFTRYRPDLTYYKSTAQLSNKEYKIDTVYYFKYEPIKWKILDPNTGFVISDIILDSQPFVNDPYYVFDSDTTTSIYFRDESCSSYANNYELSSIRQWLNDDFYNTSFSPKQKSNISVSTVDNQTACADTEDNIFLLSVSEVKSYSDEVIMPDNDKSTATDYARCQGLSFTRNNYSSGESYQGYNWQLRSVSRSNYTYICYPVVGVTIPTSNICQVSSGVRPACRLSVLKSDTDIDTQPDDGNDDKEINSNISWTYDGNCRLYISGNGAINYADSYGWKQYSDEIMYVEIGDGITALPENIFSNMPYLTEVYLGSDIETIADGAFADCPLLTAVTFNSNAEISETAFANAGQDLTFILNGSTELPKAFAESNGIKTVTVSYDESKKILSFSGDVAVFDYTKYYSLNNILYQFKDTEYLYFTRLIFVDADPNINIQDDEIDSEVTPRGLILNNVYISLVHISEDGNRQNVSFAKMLEMLESGDYTAFKYHAKSDEQEEEGTLISKIVDNIRRALQFITKLINFIRNLIMKIRR